MPVAPTPIKRERSASLRSQNMPVAPRRSGSRSAPIVNQNNYDSSDDEYLDDDDADNYLKWSGFEVTRSLPRCDENKYTLRDLMALLDTPNIDLSPDYQRSFVWNEETQVGLINSIFQGYYVPGLIFNKRVTEVLGIRREILVVIDGKQRLTSVKRFTDGQIACHDRHGKKWWFRQAAGEKIVRGRKFLPQAAQAVFWEKTFTCHQYVGMTLLQENDLFQRVQKGCPLTLAEKARAKGGEWQSLARSFEDQYPRLMNLSDSSRGRGYDKFISSFAQIVEGQKAAANADDDNVAPIIFRGTSTGTQRLFTTEGGQNPCTVDQQARMKRVFDRFSELVECNPGAFANDGLNPKSALAPIEFVAVAFLVDQYEAKSNAEMEQAIRKIRRDVREAHSDNVRRKDMVWEFLLKSMQQSLGNRKRSACEEQDDSHRATRRKFGLE